MKTYFIILILAVIYTAGISQQQITPSFSKAYQKAKLQGDKALADLFQDKADKYTNQPMYYAAKSTYLWNKASKENPVMKSNRGGPVPEGNYQVQTSNTGGFVITDPKTGKQVGTLTAEPRIDPKYLQQAQQVIETARSKFPNRTDFPIGLASLHFKNGNYDEVFNTFQSLCDYVSNNPDAKFRGRENSDNREIYNVVDVDPNVAVPEAIFTYTNKFWALGNEQGDANVLRLGQLSTQHFPNCPKAWNMLAAYYSVQKDSKKVLECLKQAHQAAPEDTIVLINLAHTYALEGDNKKAKSYYQKIINLAPSEAEVARAKAAIAKLK